MIKLDLKIILREKKGVQNDFDRIVLKIIQLK